MCTGKCLIRSITTTRKITGIISTVKLLLLLMDYLVMQPKLSI